jgi:hypothetical protein
MCIIAYLCLFVQRTIPTTDMEKGITHISDYTHNTTTALRRLYVGYVDVTNQFQKDIQTNTILASSMEVFAHLHGGSLAAAMYVFVGCLSTVNTHIRTHILETSARALLADLQYEFRQTQALQVACSAVKKCRSDYLSACHDRDNKQAYVNKLRVKCDSLIARKQQQLAQQHVCEQTIGGVGVGVAKSPTHILTQQPFSPQKPSAASIVQADSHADGLTSSEQTHTDDTADTHTHKGRLSSVNRYTGIEANGYINAMFADNDEDEDHDDDDDKDGVDGIHAHIQRQSHIGEDSQQTHMYHTYTHTNAHADGDGNTGENSRLLQLSTATIVLDDAPLPPPPPVYTPKEQQQFAGTGNVDAFIVSRSGIVQGLLD